MINPLVTFTDTFSTATPDVTFDFGDFSATTVVAAANSDAGREFFAQMFGAGAVSVNLPKSKASDFAVYCQQKGLAV